MYNDKILEIFYNPQNVGVIKGANGVGKISDKTCGEIVKIYISVKSDKIEEVTFQAFGSPALIAAASKATVLMSGKSLDECKLIKVENLLAELGGNIPENKRYVLALVEACIKSAVENFYKKN